MMKFPSEVIETFLYDRHVMGDASGVAGGGQLPPVPYALPPDCPESS